MYGILLNETGTNWTQAPESKQPSELFRGGRGSRIVAAHNTNENIPADVKNPGITFIQAEIWPPTPNQVS